MGEQMHGIVEIFDSKGSRSFTFDPAQANLGLGGKNADGTIVLTDNMGTPRVVIESDLASIQIRGPKMAGQTSGEIGLLLQENSIWLRRLRLDGLQANLWLGGGGADGDIALYRSDAKVTDDPAVASIHLDGQEGDIRAGRSISIGEGSNPRLHLDGRQGNVWVGGAGADGDIILFPKHVTTRDGALASIHLNGESGDIILRNADCAEDFEVEDATAAPPGTVLVIGEDGRLRESDTPYDRRVAGVVSGAGEFRPGIVLGREPGRARRVPVALAGRVACLADASDGPIAVGDLLTTSARPGHAMAVEDSSAAFGAVLGKALAPLHEGIGLVPALVCLQ